MGVEGRIALACRYSRRPGSPRRPKTELRKVTVTTERAPAVASKRLPPTLGRIAGRERELRRSIERRHRVLARESIWLFLATLGCWSVSPLEGRLLAFGITVVVVLGRLWSVNELETERGPIQERIQRLRNELSLCPLGAERNRLLACLDQDEMRIRTWTLFLRSWPNTLAAAGSLLFFWWSVDKTLKSW